MMHVPTVYDVTVLTGQNLWAEVKKKKKTYFRLRRLSESTYKWRLRRYKGFEVPFTLSSPTSALGSGLMHDMRQSVCGYV